MELENGHRIIQEQYIAALIVKEATNTIDEEERAELQAWLTESDENREAYGELQQMHVGSELKLYREIDVNRKWETYRRKYSPNRYRMRIYWPVAAAIAIILIGTGLWLGIQQTKVQDDIAAIYPGNPKATLVLNDGSVRNITELKEDHLATEGFIVKKDSNTIYYTPPVGYPGNENKTAYNEIRIPRGGEYQLVLSDGTHVWLNSQSTLRFPVNFSGPLREVTLQGEAYFEVAKDKVHPFIVRTRDNINVQVLGTSFNVRAYADEKDIEVVLEAGVVRMKTSGQEVMLKPGEMSCYNTKTRNMDKQSVNTANYTGWRKGQCIFIRRRIEDIFKELARWYNMEVFYRNEAAKNIVFSGSIKRYDSIRPLLEAIEIAGGIKFEIKGNVLVIDTTDQ